MLFFPTCALFPSRKSNADYRPHGRFWGEIGRESSRRLVPLVVSADSRSFSTQSKHDFFPHLIIINSGAKIFFLQQPENEALCKVICPFLFCRGPRLCDLACTPFFPDCFQAGGSSGASSYLLLGPTFLLHVAREFPRHERERLESRGVGGCWTITEHPGFRDDDDNCRIFSKV